MSRQQSAERMMHVVDRIDTAMAPVVSRW